MDEEKLILDALSGIALPEDVKRIELKFAPDSTGVPSVWINLHIDDDYHPSDAKIDRLSRVKRAISAKLLDSQLTSWPYVKLVAD